MEESQNPHTAAAPKQKWMEGGVCPEVKRQGAVTWPRGPGSKCCPSIKVVWEHGVQALCFCSLWWTNWYLYLPQDVISPRALAHCDCLGPGLEKTLLSRFVTKAKANRTQLKYALLYNAIVAIKTPKTY